MLARPAWRGISRIYQMSLREGVWKLWRDALGFSQRFEGTFNDDGRTITGRWEKSGDGVQWEIALDLSIPGPLGSGVTASMC